MRFGSRTLARSDLTLLRGPERIQTAWWQQSIYRDYYVARHRNGAECWAFFDMQKDTQKDTQKAIQKDAQGHDREQWYLHGYFA